MKIITKKKQEELLQHILALTAIASDAVLMSNEDKDAEYMVNTAKSVAHHAMDACHIAMGMLGSTTLLKFVNELSKMRDKNQWPSINLMEHEKKEGTI